MKIALFSMGSESSKRILEALEKEFDEVKHYDIRKVEVRIGRGEPLLLYEGKKIDNGYDCVYLKSSFRYANIQKALATYFGNSAYMPIETDSFTIVNDKTLTHLKLEDAQIPTPETYITPTVSAAKKLMDEINFPIILKIPGGTHGKGVMYAESAAAAKGILDTLSELKQTVLLQEYIETGGSDIRAIVIGDKVVAAMSRKASSDDKRSNLHAGGKSEAVELDSHTKKVAVNAAKALKAEICAVDVLESVKGPKILEANLSPGLQGIMDATKVDIPSKIAKHLRERTENFKKTEDNHAENIVEESSSKDNEQQIITKLDYRGERILIPQSVSKMSKITEDDEVIVKVKKGQISLQKNS